MQFHKMCHYLIKIHFKNNCKKKIYINVLKLNLTKPECVFKQKYIFIYKTTKLKKNRNYDVINKIETYGSKYY